MPSNARNKIGVTVQRLFPAYIQNDSNIIKAKNFSHVLRGDDLMLFIRHKTKNKAIAWANENEDNVFNV